MKLLNVQDERGAPFSADLSAYGGEVTVKLRTTLADFRARSDDPGQQIHSLFAGLYLHDHLHWKGWLDRHGDDGFFYLFMDQFYKAYDGRLASFDGRNSDPMSPGWRIYDRLAARRTMRSSIWMHLLIIIIATRAHVQDDIGNALVGAAQRWNVRFGYWPNLSDKKHTFFRQSHGDLFGAIALDFIHHQRKDQSGYRRILLRFFAILLPMTKFLWWPVLNRWRRQSWARGEAEMQAMRADHTEQNSDNNLAMP